MFHIGAHTLDNCAWFDLFEICPAPLFDLPAGSYLPDNVVQGLKLSVSSKFLGESYAEPSRIWHFLIVDIYLEKRITILLGLVLQVL